MRCDPSTLTTLIQCGTSFFQLAVPVLVALALLYFFWGIASFILKVDDKEEMKKGRARMLWGVVALFLIVSIAGLLAVVQNTFFVGRTPTSLHTTPDGSANAPIVDPSLGGRGDGLFVEPREQGTIRFGSTRDRDARRFPYFCVLGRYGDCPLR